ncbi:MAG: hypothetical protein IPG50_28680 [Myxococcales bacterium]|nr:hypothetical protein [Myxococcales bacterium]
MISKILGGLFLVGYSTVMFSGIDFSSHQKSEVSPSMRQSPGGYRTWAFWHAGSSGGK